MKREPLRSWLARHIMNRVPVPRVRGRVDWGRLRARLVFYLFIVLFVLSPAGILTGIGFFVLTMIEVYFLGVALSSILLTASIAVFLFCYFWATGGI